MRRVLYLTGSLAALLLLVAISTLMTVQSDWFFLQVKNRIIMETEKATGGRVEMESFHFEWKTMTATARGFTLHGTEAAAEQPLLRSGSIQVGLKLVSALRRDVDIASLVIDRPQVNILVRPDGSTNFPKPPVARRNTKNPLELVISLAIGRIELKDASVRFDSRVIPLNVVARDVRSSLQYDTAADRYLGSVEASPLELRTAFMRSLSLQRLETSLVLDKNAITFPQALMAMKDSVVEASGALKDLKRPAAAFRVKSRISVSDAADFVPVPLRHEGTAEFQGDVSLGTGRPLDIKGTFSAVGLGYAYHGFEVRSARASGGLHYAGGRLLLSGLRVNSGEGTFDGEAVVEPDGRFRVKGSADQISLAQAVLKVSKRESPWNGRVSGPVEISGLARGGWRGLTVSSQLKIVPGEGENPLSGSVDLLYSGEERKLKLRSSYVQTRASRFAAEGTLGDKLQVSATTSNLNDVLPAIALFSDQPPPRFPLQLEGGEARFEGSVTGSLDNPQIEGDARLRQFVVDQRRVDSFFGHIRVTSDELSAREATIYAGPLRVRGNIKAGLQFWKLVETSPLSAALSAQGADLAALLAKSGEGPSLRGVVNGSATVSGTWGKPTGSGRIEIDKPAMGSEEFDHAAGDFTYADGRIRLTSGTVSANGVTMSAQGEYVPEPQDWKHGTLRVEGATRNFPLVRLDYVRRLQAKVDGLLDVKGDAVVRLEGGRLRVIAVNGHAAARDLSLDKRKVGRVTLDAVTKGNAVTLSAYGLVRDSRIEGAGTFELAGDYPGTGKVSVPRLDFSDLEPFLPAESKGSMPVRGFVIASASIGGSATGSEGLRADVRIERIEVRPRDREQLGKGIETPADLDLHNVKPIMLAVDSKGVRLSEAELVGRNTDLRASGTLDWRSRNPWDLKLKGSVDLAILTSFKPDLLSAGSSTVDATVRGSLSQPQINGRMELANASFSLRGMPNGIDKANGVVLFDRNRANIERLEAQTGGGDMRLTGFVGIGGDDVLFRLQAAMSKVRVRYPEGVSTTIDAALSLTGTYSRSLLSGTVSIVRSGFTPRTDLASLLSQAGRPAPAVATQNEFLQGLQFDVRVDTTPDVQVQTSLTRDLQTEADLRLRGSPAKPVLLGTVAVNRGEIQFFGNKYQISRGEISFFNSAKIEPVLNMDVETRVRAVTVNINFAGPLDKLNVTYRSDPPLQASEIVALLTVGRSPMSTDPSIASSQQAGNQSLFQSGANSLLGQAVTAPVSSRLQRFFGVSRLKIDPQLTGIDNTPQARLTLEQQISRDVTLTYVTNLTRSQQQLVRLEWNVSQEWSVIAVRDENGLFGMDFQYRRQFK